MTLRLGYGVIPPPLSPESQAELDAEIDALMRQQARRTAVYMIKVRARRYLRRPVELEAIAPGLVSASGVRLIAWGEHFLEGERGRRRRWFGFGAEVPALNARAVILLGRYRRRFDGRLRRVA